MPTVSDELSLIYNWSTDNDRSVCHYLWQTILNWSYVACIILLLLNVSQIESVVTEHKNVPVLFGCSCWGPDKHNILEPISSILLWLSPTKYSLTLQSVLDIWDIYETKTDFHSATFIQRFIRKIRKKRKENQTAYLNGNSSIVNQFFSRFRVIIIKTFSFLSRSVMY